MKNTSPEIWYSTKTNQIFELGHWGIPLNTLDILSASFLKLIYVNDEYYICPDSQYLAKYCIKIGEL